MFHFRDQIRAGNPTAFFVLNGDVCADFPLQELYDFHKSRTSVSEVLYNNPRNSKIQINRGKYFTD